MHPPELRSVNRLPTLNPRRSAGLSHARTRWLAATRTVPSWIALGVLMVLAISPLGALEWQAGPGFRRAPLAVPTNGRDGFSKLPPLMTGISFSNQLSRMSAAFNQILLNGSGVAAGDVNGDELCDLYFCCLEGSNVLYRNLGHWQFEDITAAAGVACPDDPSTGAVLADLDGDRDLDLLVNSVGGGTRCFRNDGQGHFTEDTQAGLLRERGSTTLALADIEGDGDLDLYVANYRTTTVRSTGFEVLNVNGRRMLRPEDQERLYVTPEGFLREHGEVDVLYLNDGQRHFQPLSWTDGRFLDAAGQPLKTPPRDWALSALFRDLNEDGAPDLYVCNDFWSPDKIWINDGKGRFREIAREALPCTSTFSMCADFADINRDGYDDFYVLDMFSPNHVQRVTQTISFGLTPWPLGYSQERPQVTRNTLFLNRGDGTYAEIAQLSGVQATDWSWSPLFIDVDLDGYEDILVATGNLYDTQDQDAEMQIKAKGPWTRERTPFKLWMYPPLPLPKIALRNRGDLTFEEVGAAWGFHEAGVCHGMCLADLDNDGDLDVAVNQLNTVAGIYRNESPRPRVAVRLRGQGGNTGGVGARITVLGGPVPRQSQERICGGRYLSGDDGLRMFAAGSASQALRIDARWRNGTHTMVPEAQANHLYELNEAGSTSVVTSSPRLPAKPFVDASHLIPHTHRQAAFDDFSRQPLLPKKLSQLGPGVSWFDWDGDGWEDLVLAGGRDQPPAVFQNDRRGGFTRRELKGQLATPNRSQTAVLGIPRIGEPAELLVGLSNYEDGQAEGPSALALLATAGSESPFPGSDASTGPLALADIDGDGDLDLFIGGRVVPGRFPEPASSRLFRRLPRGFELDLPNQRVLEKVGLVSGAMFSDLDGDGDPDLVLACEWGPIRVYRNTAGQLAEITDSLGLAKFTGWWQGVASGDFDGDGRLDLVASNWGRNSPYENHRARPLRLLYGDFNETGQVDLIEAYFDVPMGKWVPERAFEAMAGALPFLRERYPTHRAFAEASVADLLGNRAQRAHELSATTLESMVFLNRGDRFEAIPLPLEAQFAPAFGVCTGDMDGDGRTDVFLSQNFFAPQPSVSPYDSGRGLWLRGDGQGGFQSVPGQESGLMIYGEQRGCALADYDQDGRLDLVVTQNASTPRLFHNTGARPGLRVRLVGPPQNPAGTGVLLRLVYGKHMGPLTEVQTGSGYWSQDGAVKVLATPEPPSALWIHWPWAKPTTQNLPPNSHEISVDPQGSVRKTQPVDARSP